MQRIYTHPGSSHRREFTETLLRSHVRTRSGHGSRTLIGLIGAKQASERLGLSPRLSNMGYTMG